MMKRFLLLLLAICFLPAISAGEALNLDLFGKWKYTPRDLCINTDLVKDGKAAVTIVGNQDLALELVKAIQAKTGVTVSVSAKAPAQGNIITIGNRDRNDFVCTLYNHHYTLQDAKYPGKGGYEVRSLHNPYGDRRNIILCAGSDLAGDRVAVKKLAEKINALPKGKNLTLGYIADVKLAPSYKVPEDAKDAKLWEQSVNYGNKGYFGWNSLSKNLALFYATGKKQYADEFLRLAFPKDKATEKELFKRDGEAYKDDYSDPIKSVYHYCAVMMILYWDLVEESPVWTEADRKKVNEAFYRQLHYTLTKKDYTNPIRYFSQPAQLVVERHRDWEGTSLFAVARFFNKYYPCPESKVADQVVRNLMEPRFKEFCYGTINRNSAHSNMAPAFLYATLSGDKKYVNNPVVKEYGRALLILCHWNNRPDKPSREPFFGMSSMYALMHFAYMTQDNAFIRILQNLPLDKECFRLGQSYYPAKPYPRDSATEANGKWNAIRSADWLIKPEPPFPLKYAFNCMSYHDTTDDTGDYWLYDTSYAQSLRETARSLSIYHLRIDGVPVLAGHGNTMRLYADGTSVAPQPYHAKMVNFGVSGPFVYAEALVPKCDDFDWKRTAILRKRSYMIIADELTPLRDLKTGEFYNDFYRPWRASVWKARPQTHEFIMDATPDGRNRKYLFSTSCDAEVYTVPLSWTAHPLNLRLSGMKTDWKKGETLKFVTIIRIGDALQTPSTAQMGDQVAMALPEPAMFRWTADGVELLSKDGKLTSGPGKWQFAADVPVPADTVLQMLAARKLPEVSKENPGTAPLPEKISYFDIRTKRVKVLTVDGKPWLLLAGQRKLILADENLRTVMSRTMSADIGAIEYQHTKKRILVGCKDETVTALDLTGKELWSFTSQMHPQLYKFGPYWHKSAIPGIRSLLAASWPDGTEQIFVGSAGTLEILDADGKFLARKYVQFGPVSGLFMQKDPARLWILRRTGGAPFSYILTPDLNVRNANMLVDAQRISMARFGFNAIGKRLLLFRGDRIYGDFSGVQNRVMLWDQKGKALAHANLGADSAASSQPYDEDLKDADHLRFLDVLEDGTVTAVTNRERLYFWTPDLKLKNMTILPGQTYGCASDGKSVYTGMDNGEIWEIKPNGTRTLLGRLSSRIQTILCRDGKVYAGDTSGTLAVW